MSATQRRRLNTSRQLPYRFAGDPRELGYQTIGQAFNAASIYAERAHPRDDGEEYRHGIFCNDRKVGVVVRETNGTVTATRTEGP